MPIPSPSPVTISSPPSPLSSPATSTPPSSTSLFQEIRCFIYEIKFVIWR
jgi:hypothetical protein